MKSTRHPSSEVHHRFRKSSVYSDDQLLFLRSHLPSFRKTPVYSKERSDFITEITELFHQKFDHQCKLKDLRKNIQRWCMNSSRYGNHSQAKASARTSFSSSPRSSHQPLENARTPRDKDLQVLAALFGTELGYDTVSAFRVFVDHNLERIASLVSQKLSDLKPGERKRSVAGITRRIQSSEFAKLSSCELDRYEKEAAAETERNRRSFEVPASPETILRNQLHLDDVLHKVCSALLDDGPLSIGKGAFHIQYSLVGQSGPFSRTLFISSLDKRYSESQVYKTNRVEETWMQWSLDNLMNELPLGTCSTSLAGDDVYPETDDLFDLRHEVEDAEICDAQSEVSKADDEQDNPQPYASPFPSDAGGLDPATGRLPMSAEAIKDIAARVIGLAEQESSFTGLASDDAKSDVTCEPSQHSARQVGTTPVTSPETSHCISPSSVVSMNVPFLCLESDSPSPQPTYSLCQEDDDNATSALVFVTNKSPDVPIVAKTPDDGSPRRKHVRKPSPGPVRRVGSASNRNQLRSATTTQADASTLRSKRTIKATERAEYLKEETLRKNARKLQRQTRP